MRSATQPSAPTQRNESQAPTSNAILGSKIRSTMAVTPISEPIRISRTQICPSTCRAMKTVERMTEGRRSVRKQYSTHTRPANRSDRVLVMSSMFSRRTRKTYRIPTCSPEMANKCIVPLAIKSRSRSGVRWPRFPSNKASAVARFFEERLAFNAATVC